MLRLTMSHNQEQFEGTCTYVSVYNFTGENYIASLRIQSIQALFLVSVFKEKDM